VTWDRDRIRCRFLSNWTRIRLFGNENVGFLKDFAKEMLEVTSRQMSLAGINAAPVLTVDELNKIVANWGENIQFSSPRGSIKDADALISDIAPLYLRQRRHAGARANARSSSKNSGQYYA
jgi:hypothetical protein